MNCLICKNKHEYSRVRCDVCDNIVETPLLYNLKVSCKCGNITLEGTYVTFRVKLFTEVCKSVCNICDIRMKRLQKSERITDRIVLKFLQIKIKFNQ